MKTTSKIFIAAAKVGGIIANSTYPAEFIFSNMQVQMNVKRRGVSHGFARMGADKKQRGLLF